MTKNKKNFYKKLQEISKNAAILNSVYYLLEWDQETMMPKDGIFLRPLQIEKIAHIMHKEKTSKQFVCYREAH